jgi:hypothetical protein
VGGVDHPPPAEVLGSVELYNGAKFRVIRTVNVMGMVFWDVTQFVGGLSVFRQTCWEGGNV